MHVPLRAPLSGRGCGCRFARLFVEGTRADGVAVRAAVAEVVFVDSAFLGLGEGEAGGEAGMRGVGSGGGF